MFGAARVVPRKQESNMILTVTMNPSIDTRDARKDRWR